MKPFAYATARSVESALELVKDKGRFIAGGIDLLGELKEGLAEPALLVNVKRLPGSYDIAPGEQKWTFGTNVTLAMLADDPGVRRVFPGLAEAAGHVGSPQMRNVGTLGGNLAQHSRCWYYRQRDLACAKKGKKRCLARDGENKYHSLFTGCVCLSPCVSNLAVALTALDASVVVQRGGKTVTWKVEELYATAWKTAAAHNSLGAEDLILRVEVPTAASSGRSAYLQMGEKHDFDWALVSCAAAGKLERGLLSSVRIAVGCVAPVPWQAAEANASLEGKELSEANANAAAEILLKGAEPRGKNGYKLPLAKVLVRRTLMRLGAV